MVSRKQKLRAAGASIAALSLAVATPAAAQSGGIYEYPVKFFCGLNEQPSVNPAAMQGIYATAINVYNPRGIVLFTHLVSLSGAGRPAGHSPVITSARLGPNDALEVDCHQIALELLRGGVSANAFHTGFFVIQSRAELDVVAVYTAAATRDSGVSSIHSERVPVRRRVR